MFMLRTIRSLTVKNKSDHYYAKLINPNLTNSCFMNFWISDQMLLRLWWSQNAGRGDRSRCLLWSIVVVFVEIVQCREDTVLAQTRGFLNFPC
ncbi:hypothetical protein CsSME_00019221 [Camellia sinensis var. sinensis]